jgi:hypothetical protein
MIAATIQQGERQRHRETDTERQRQRDMGARRQGGKEATGRDAGNAALEAGQLCIGYFHLLLVLIIIASPDVLSSYDDRGQREG